MARDFQRLSEVTRIEEVTENASVLVEENGEIYRVPKTAVGGDGTIKTAIIRDSGYLNAIAGVQTMTAAPEYTYECLNMTFEEAYEIMANGEPLSVFGMLTGEGGMTTYGIAAFAGDAIFGVPCIVISFSMVLSADYIASTQLYWTADGLSTEAPSSGK